MSRFRHFRPLVLLFALSSLATAVGALSDGDGGAPLPPLIATHNSATGEEGRGMLSWLLTPFARCQGKTLREQYAAGTRYFDIRVRRLDNGEWHCAHGPWESRRTAEDILSEINSFGPVFARVFYEGHAPAEFFDKMECWRAAYSQITFTHIGERKPVWHILKEWVPVRVVGGFVALNSQHWQVCLPVPILWKTIYYNTPKFNSEVFTAVDWL